ncbi:hypothetical protein BDV12DRAFT_163358 [Aspergillus spectabilis]
MVVSHLISTFPKIRFGMMVGIGGGSSSDGHDIHLGDVVVSKPTGLSSGVVQYDYEKVMQVGRFEMTGRLNHPPQILLTHMSLLQATMTGLEDGYIYPMVQKC